MALQLTPAPPTQLWVRLEDQPKPAECDLPPNLINPTANLDHFSKFLTSHWPKEINEGASLAAVVIYTQIVDKLLSSFQAVSKKVFIFMQIRPGELEFFDTEDLTKPLRSGTLLSNLRTTDITPLVVRYPLS